MLRKALLLPGLFALVMLSLVFNIAVHESGHYVVAKAFGLNPRISLEGGTGFIWNNQPIAYTSYVGGTKAQDILISLAGPLANVLVLFGSAFLYRKSKTFGLKIIAISLLVVALLSFISNILPTSGSDGLMIINSL